MSIRIVLRFAFLAATAVLLSGCPGGSGDLMPALKQLSPETQVLLAKQGMRPESPIFVRIFKEESQLEIWKAKDDGRFYLFKTYPICTWSGDLGPKVNHGDKQAPEGFYTVTPGQMNPNSKFHLAFNLGFPNAYDKANGHTGDSLMVHGDCRSAGCFAMTDALIEEIYVLARESFQGGQTQFQVHAFPFRLTEANMMHHRDNRWYSFWRSLKEGYDAFEVSRVPPKVAVCSRQYLVNASFFGQVATPDPAANCPAYRKLPPDPFDPFGNGMQAKASTPDARVAAYTAPVSQAAMVQAQTAKVNAPQPAKVNTAQPGQPAPTRAASVSAQPPIRAAQPQDERQTALAAVTVPRVQARPVVNTVPVVATFQQEQTTQETDPQTADSGKPLVTRGIHNVVESGKGDMIVTPRAMGGPAQ